MKLRITSTGFYVPEHVETSADLSPRVGRSPEWIRSRTGVEKRHISQQPDVAILGAAAARQALENSPQPDLLINASGLPRQVLPDNAVFIQRELGLDGIPSFTIHATCLSFLVGLKVAGSLLGNGFQRILLVSAELTSIGRNFDEPESSVLVGDGAAAAMIEGPLPDTFSEILFWGMDTWPEGAGFTEVIGGGTRRHPRMPDVQPEEHLFHMSGPKVYKFARAKVGDLLERMYAETGLSCEDIDLVVPHQASGPALNSLPRYGFPEEKVVNIVSEYGNCVAASLPMALHTALESGRLQPGMHVLLLGTGAGLSVAATLIRW